MIDYKKPLHVVYPNVPHVEKCITIVLITYEHLIQIFYKKCYQCHCFFCVFVYLGADHQVCTLDKINHETILFCIFFMYKMMCVVKTSTKPFLEYL